MFMTTTFWFLVAFVLFFVLFGRTIWKLIAKFLDDRAEQIETDIKDAARIKDEAQAALNDIKNRHLQAEKHAEAILEHARLEADRLRSEASKEMDEFLKQKELLVEQRIKFAEQEAIKDIRDTAVKLAIEASEKILTNIVTTDTNNRIVDKAIEELKTS